MMQHEFEEIAGYPVSTVDYDKVIEPMYMSLNMSKKEFVTLLNRDRFDLNRRINKIVKEMKTICKDRKLNCEHFSDYEAIEHLKEFAEQYINLKFPYTAYKFDIIMSKTYKTFGYEYPSGIYVMTPDCDEVETLNLID